jgi:hypothetical protein
MRRLLATASLAAVLMTGPAVAYAQTAELAAREGVDIGAGVVTLVAASWLLVVALRLAKVAAGSAYADNIRYVVLGSLCLAGSVLASWSTHFMPDAFTSAQSQLGANLFIVVAILFFAVYFTRVLRALSKFVRAARAMGVATAKPSGEAEGDDLADLLPQDPARAAEAEASSGHGDDAGGSDG